MEDVEASDERRVAEEKGARKRWMANVIIVIT